ncbi:MAG: citramalate synthase [Nitrospinae bacterium]|nr:citramalate synthase [Nitrospinota bacterium]
MSGRVFIYDTTLRDGSQAQDVSFSLQDKLRITEKLDDLGVHYVEGGFPGSNPKDAAYFTEVRKLKLKQARIAAFGSTHHPAKTPATDSNLRLLLNSKAPVVTLVGKTWDVHVTKVLRTTKPHNLKLITGSIRYMKPKVDEVVFDAEHFFDAYKHDSLYAMECIEAALAGGAGWVVLCDTNGGALPHEVFDITAQVKRRFGCRIGIHVHNDGALAVANTLMAVQAGARQVQGTINGLGERCGNADLTAIIPNLQIKMGYKCISGAQLKTMREVSLFVSEMANLKPHLHQPFVGQAAFAHKGGLHVDAVLKNPITYEHISPDKVGNQRHVIMSDLAGKASIQAKAAEYGIDLRSDDPVAKQVLTTIKEMESQGFAFEGADGSLEILIKKAKGHWKKFFDVLRARVIVSVPNDKEPQYSEAVVMVKTPDGAVHHAVAEGNGPVNAMDKAFRQALVKYYPELEEVKLLDFKVRILDETAGTSAKTRVLIESGDAAGNKWGTVGVSENVIEASWQALIDSIDYKLHKKSAKKK